MAETEVCQDCSHRHMAHMIVIIQLSIDGISYEIQIVLTCRVTFTLQHMIEYELFQNFRKECQKFP